MFAILIHIYYPDSWDNIFREQLAPLRKYNPVLLVNISNINNSIDSISACIKNDFPGAVIITSPNKGKDIGGKLALIDLYLKMNLETDYMVLLHDKVSPQALRGEKWRKTLFSIVDPQSVPGILQEFKKNIKTGIIGSSDFIMNEYNADTGLFSSTNNSKIKELLTRYQINITRYNFIGGTMFWIRSVVIRTFFSRYSALGCREMLEEGNTMDDFEGTYTHTWERLMCWIAIAQNFTLKGI
jgi:lipopolysaccharide biosynthesis protein